MVWNDFGPTETEEVAEEAEEAAEGGYTHTHTTTDLNQLKETFLQCF